MTHTSHAADVAPAAASTSSGRDLNLPGWDGGPDRERDRLIVQARSTDAVRQLQRCFPRWARAFEHLSSRALVRLANNEPVDPNDRDAWRTADEHAQAVLRRHGITLNPRHLTLAAIQTLIDGQACADADAGLDWTRTTAPASQLDEKLRRAHATLPVDLSDPAVFGDVGAQRHALASRLGLPAGQADDLSRWVLAHPDQFDPAQLRCWRIASPTWLQVAGEQLEAVDRVQRPVALFVMPAIRGGGWQLTPVLSLDAIRLLVSLGGQLDRDLRSAVVPATAARELIERINVHTLHAGPKECLDSAGQLAQELTRELGTPIGPGAPKDKRDRWGRLLITRRSYRGRDGTATAELELRVVTFPAREYSQRRLGAARRDDRYGQASAVMDLGEAVQAAVERGLPLLLSTEAAGHLAHTVRVGRMKGRPGALTITSSDGLSATTRRVVAEQAVSELRALKQHGMKVTLDAGARQLMRMTLARPLADDPVLLGRQQEIAALKVVGSGVDASQVGSGKCCAPDTRVFVNGALTRIDELWERFAGPGWSDQEGLWARLKEPLVTNSLADDGRMVVSRISAMYRQRVRERGRRITLDDGSVITITNSHRLLSLDEWTRHLVPGDFVCVPQKLSWAGEPLPYELVELVAWQLAEGHELDHTQGRRWPDRVVITQKDTSVLNRLRRLATALGERYRIRMNTMPISQRPDRAATLTIASSAYRKLLERELEYTWGRRSAHKRIPDRVMAAEDLTVIAFLRAFFDAEGSVIPRHRRVEITSASREVIDQLSTLLRRFRVWLRISRKEKAATNGTGIRREYWTGYIAGESLRRYAEQIGFGDVRKRERLAHACEPATNTNVECVRIADVLTKLRAAGMPGRWLLPHRFESFNGIGMSPRLVRESCAAIRTAHDHAMSRSPGAALSRTAVIAARKVSPDELEQTATALERRAERQVFYARVVSVDDVVLNGWVYDLEVAEHHNFVAGGMLAHNTVTTGRALANRAVTTRRLRAMVVAEGRLLGQWHDELALGAPGRGLPPLAPNLEVLVVDERRPIAGQIRDFDRALAERPGVVLVPNSVLDRYPADLQVIPWHLLIADEALRYANPATDAHQALKLVRFGSVADCWLLTATPRGKSAEHLDVLVGLAVGDEAMITERLNTREGGDLMDEINAHRLRVNYGPHLVRVTRQDMQAWMPQVRPAKPLAIDPDPALRELLEAIRQGGREAYRRLLEVLRELRTLEAGRELFKQALAELSRAQGVVLGNVGVFVDASVDPETLTHSQAALAKALVRQGLVADAMRGGGDGLPLLRGITAQTLASVAAEEQVIVFAERVWCLRQLARTLGERHGVQAQVADGQVKPSEFEELKHAFTSGEFPVLCLSKIGHEGHNLQTASVICHLDLPWLPSGLEQRVGRAARPGAARAWVQTYIPYIRGAGVEHIVSILSPRGAEHHAVLDSFEGVAANQSTVATQLGQITGQVADAKQDAGYAATAARLRVAASVFGT